MTEANGLSSLPVPGGLPGSEMTFPEYLRSQSNGECVPGSSSRWIDRPHELSRDVIVE